MPTALITGITGQDGSYLTELLLAKDYQVHGVVRRTSNLERSRIRHLYFDKSLYEKQLFLHYAELNDSTTLRRILVRAEPDEIYHLAGQSHIGISFEIPESTCDLTAIGTLRLLELLRDMENPPKLFHASSSEIYGVAMETPQSENTPHNPANPYACAKSFATQMVKVYRESFQLFATNGIMYNHESPRRGENFVTQKICHSAAAIKKGRQKALALGNINLRRDWGYAPDYVKGMWISLQQDRPSDYLLATGTLHTIRDILDIAFEVVDLDWRDHVIQDKRFIRPAEPKCLVGDCTKAKKELGWKHSINFRQMIQEMTEHAMLHSFIEGS